MPCLGGSSQTSFGDGFLDCVTPRVFKSNRVYDAYPSRGVILKPMKTWNFVLSGRSMWGAPKAGCLELLSEHREGLGNRFAAIMTRSRRGGLDAVRGRWQVREYSATSECSGRRDVGVGSSRLRHCKRTTQRQHPCCGQAVLFRPPFLFAFVPELLCHSSSLHSATLQLVYSCKKSA